MLEPKWVGWRRVKCHLYKGGGQGKRGDKKLWENTTGGSMQGREITVTFNKKELDYKVAYDVNQLKSRAMDTKSRWETNACSRCYGRRCQRRHNDVKKAKTWYFLSSCCIDEMTTRPEVVLVVPNSSGRTKKKAVGGRHRCAETSTPCNYMGSTTAVGRNPPSAGNSSTAEQLWLLGWIWWYLFMV